MFGIRKLFVCSVLILCISLGLSEDSFFWKMFSHGKAILSNLKKLNKSDRRTEDGGTGQEAYQDTEVEHRETSGEHLHAPVAQDNYYGDYNGYTQVIHRDNMELYSLLGGLSFASLLATTLVILSRRNGSLLRSSQDDFFRKNGHRQGNYEVVIKLPQFLYRMGRHFARPWWWSGSEERKAKGLMPFSIVHPDLVDN